MPTHLLRPHESIPMDVDQMPMPLPQKRHRSSSSSSNPSDDDGGGPSLRRYYYDLSGSSYSRQRRRAEDCSSSNSGDDDGGPLLRRYQPSLLDERLDRLNLPPSADGIEPDSVEVDRPDLLPYGEILEALTCSSFFDDKMLRDAVAEYQVHKYLCEETAMDCDDPGGNWYVAERPREFHTANEVAMYSVDDDIPSEEFVKDLRLLNSRTALVDEYDELDEEEFGELELKRALYRIKALLLLKGKAIDKMDDAALERKYPRKIIVENSYFLKYNEDDAFGWHFDSKLCELAALTDYQRLVISNYVEDRYEDWSQYRSQYNTPETDREYLLYWKTITEKIKWIEDHMYVETHSREWTNVRTRATYQAIRIATGFENIHRDLALLGIEDLLWSTRLYVFNLKDLDGVFYEIWKRVVKEENVKDCFAEALKEVYDLKMFPSRERSMKCEQTMAEQFRLCTSGITKQVPESVARGLIAQRVRDKLAMTRGYEHYARKKLKVAEYIGLIGKAST